jgi:hypothetical protein
MNVNIFVITHKKVDLPVPEGFSTLLVGAVNHPEINCYEFRDDVGENISFKNKNYCELTGVYWIWKNIKSDVVGICHYRRYFTETFYSSNPDKFLNAKDVKKLMGKYEVIVPKLNYYKKPVIEFEKIAPNKADLIEIKKAIENVCPEYSETYSEFLSGKKTYLFNMCIMKKKHFDAYCEWLFGILSFIEKNHDMSVEDDYRQRLFGFLSERLLWVWIEKNIPKNKIKHCRVIKTDETAFKLKFNEVKNCYRFIIGNIV